MANAVKDESNGLSVLYRQHSVAIRRHAMRILKDKSLAEDVTQETFMAYHRYLQKNKLTSSPSSLLYCIATRACFQHLRKQSVRRAEAFDDTTTPSGEQAVALDAEERRMLNRAIEVMSTKDVDVAPLYYIAGMTQREIAEVLNMPRRTVALRLIQFRRRLRRLLGLENPSEVSVG